jgi:hypothetical protein
LERLPKADRLSDAVTLEEGCARSKKPLPHRRKRHAQAARNPINMSSNIVNDHPFFMQPAKTASATQVQARLTIKPRVSGE